MSAPGTHRRRRVHPRRHPDAQIRHRLTVLRPVVETTDYLLDETTFRRTIERVFGVARAIARDREWQPWPAPTVCGTCAWAGSCPAAAATLADIPF